MMKRFVVLFAVALIAESAYPAGARYVRRDLNFSIAQPMPGARWIAGGHQNGNDVCIVESASGEPFSVIVSEPASIRVDGAWMLNMERDLIRAASATRSRIEDFRITRSSSPIEPSFFFGYTRIEADGSRSFVDGCVMAAGRLYLLQYASASRTSLDEFRAFAGSFQIVDKFEATRGLSAVPRELTVGIAMTSLNAVLGRPAAPNSVGGGTY